MEIENGLSTKEEGKKNKRWIILLVSAVIAGLLAVYLAGAFFFAGHYYWRTVIDDVDYSFQSKEKVREHILDPEVPYELALVGREDLEDRIGAKELEMSYVFDDALDRINEEMNGFTWPSMLLGDHSFTLPKTAIYNEEALTKRLKESVFFQSENIHKPEDARSGEYVSGKGYSIVPEYPGTVLDFDKVLDKVKEALEEQKPELDLEECYEGPSVTSDDSGLQKAVDQANRYISTRIKYRWNGQEELVDAEVISEWITVDGRNVELDEGKVREYVNGMSRKHDTYGRDRTFTTTEGNTVELKSGGYGWWTDRAGETEALIESIKKGEQLEKEPLYFLKGYVESENGSDIGSSYVEINLSKQHLFLYIEGELVLESDFVSGNSGRGRGTPAGVFGITYKERNATLRGENYASPVKYWMPFNGNIGMHDASWRRSFGGNIYLSSGSHGCINLPEDKAQEIYEYMETGFPVICYY